MGIYASTITRIEIRKSWSQIANGGHYGHLFFTKDVYTELFTLKEYIYITVQLTSTVQTVINASRLSKFLIIAISADNVVSIYVEGDCHRQRSHCLRWYSRNRLIA